MGKRQDNLFGLLANSGYPVIEPLLRLRRQDIQASGLGSEVQSVYEQLDGELDDFPDKVEGGISG